MKRIYFAALVGLFGCVSALSAQGRSELLLEKNWKFTLYTDGLILFLRTYCSFLL